jgi:hypothetical protein
MASVRATWTPYRCNHRIPFISSVINQLSSPAVSGEPSIVVTQQGASFHRSCRRVSVFVMSVFVMYILWCLSTFTQCPWLPKQPFELHEDDTLLIVHEGTIILVSHKDVDS